MRAGSTQTHTHEHTRTHAHAHKRTRAQADTHNAPACTEHGARLGARAPAAAARTPRPRWLLPAGHCETPSRAVAAAAAAAAPARLGLHWGPGRGVAAHLRVRC